MRTTTRDLVRTVYTHVGDSCERGTVYTHVGDSCGQGAHKQLGLSDVMSTNGSNNQCTTQCELPLPRQAVYTHAGDSCKKKTVYTRAGDSCGEAHTSGNEQSDVKSTTMQETELCMCVAV